MHSIRDKEVLHLLELAGWHKDREVDITALVASLRDEGWDVSEEAILFLSSFEGLPLIHAWRSVLFNSAQASWDRSLISYWEKKNEVNLCPVGLLDGLNSLYVGNNGRFYLSLEDGDELCAFSREFSEALRQMFFDSEYSLECQIKSVGQN